MLSHRLDNKGADQPNGAAQKERDADIAQPARIKRFLGKARLNKARHINLLAVGVHARPIERLQCVLIGFLGEAPLTLKPLICSHHPRQNFGARLFGVGHLAFHGMELSLQRLYAGVQHSDRWSIGPHIRPAYNA